MEIYLVGGAVRDTLLGRAVLEKDWVVVGASYEQCLAKGWRPIAVGVPVFLDPATGEEYAMARKERKTGIGYRGFDFEYGQHISLEEDLRRRDLTVNALAMNANGELIDPLWPYPRHRGPNLASYQHPIYRRPSPSRQIMLSLC
ncbi:MAG: hypothetical protein K0U66_08720 [Gammaproteobacteria bacterium]|nr:hypothetical protein [Gammaproteobacteria bacterium]